MIARRAKRENGGLGGGSPRKLDDLLTGPSDLDAQRGGEGALPVTARQRGSGGGTPMKYEDLSG